MGKTVRVSNEVYELIMRFQVVRETHSDVIKRAFEGFITLDAVKRGEWPPHLKEPIKSAGG